MHMEKRQYEVEGFLFTEEEAAVQAKKEASGVSYMKTKVDRNNPEKVLKFYNRTLCQF